jgi:hypothetical protein
MAYFVLGEDTGETVRVLDRVGEQGGDDGEIVPVADHGGHDRRRLDHVGDRPGEMAEKLGGEADLFLGESVGAVLREPFPGLNAAQSAVGSNAEVGQHRFDRHLLKIDADGGQVWSLGRRCDAIQCDGRHGIAPVGPKERDTPQLRVTIPSPCRRWGCPPATPAGIGGGDICASRRDESAIPHGSQLGDEGRELVGA